MSRLYFKILKCAEHLVRIDITLLFELMYTSLSMHNLLSI